MIIIKDWYKLELQTSEILTFFGSTKKLMGKTEYGENIRSLKVVEVVLIPCNLVDNQYQLRLEVLYPFTSNKSHACLLNVEATNLVFLVKLS